MDSQKEYEKINEYAASWDKIGDYTITIGELSAISDCSESIIDIISIAFRYGFEKGCRAAEKALTK